MCNYGIEPEKTDYPPILLHLFCGCFGRNKMGKLVDLSGKTFSRLTVIERTENNKHKQAQWICRCSCGAKTKVIGSHLISGNTKSCGCLFDDSIMTHGRSNSLEYRSWQMMKDRCFNKNNAEFKLYGGRGISVDDNWLSFECFYDDMGLRPKGTSIDRIDVNGDYSKDNCRWAKPVEQANNRRNNRLIEFNGVSLTVAEWGKKTGIGACNLNMRLNKLGWSVERALTERIRKRKDNAIR